MGNNNNIVGGFYNDNIIYRYLELSQFTTINCVSNFTSRNWDVTIKKALNRLSRLEDRKTGMNMIFLFAAKKYIKPFNSIE